MNSVSFGWIFPFSTKTYRKRAQTMHFLVGKRVFVSRFHRPIRFPWKVCGLKCCDWNFFRFSCGVDSLLRASVCMWLVRTRMRLSIMFVLRSIVWMFVSFFSVLSFSFSHIHSLCYPLHICSALWNWLPKQTVESVTEWSPTNSSFSFSWTFNVTGGVFRCAF